jgi:hypothetical protein
VAVMRINHSYNRRIEDYFQFRGNRSDSLKIVGEYYLYLKTTYSNHNTARVNWAAMVDYYKTHVIGKEIDVKDWVTTIPWIKHKYGHFRNDDGTPIYHISDNEYHKLMLVASDRIKMVIKAIRETNMKVGTLLGLRPYSDDIPYNLRREINNVFHGRQWIFETRDKNGYLTGKHMDVPYVSNRIKEYGRRALNKEISAESIRKVAQ